MAMEVRLMWNWPSKQRATAANILTQCEGRAGQCAIFVSASCQTRTLAVWIASLKPIGFQVVLFSTQNRVLGP
jgi:hypothetical protein